MVLFIYKFFISFYFLVSIPFSVIGITQYILFNCLQVSLSNLLTLYIYLLSSNSFKVLDTVFLLHDKIVCNCFPETTTEKASFVLFANHIYKSFAFEDKLVFDIVLTTKH